MIPNNDSSSIISFSDPVALAVIQASGFAWIVAQYTSL